MDDVTQVCRSLMFLLKWEKEAKSFVSLESNWIVVNRSQLCCVGVLNYRYTLFLTTRTSFCQLPWMD